MSNTDPNYALEVKAASEARILASGGEVLATLPILERSGPRPQTDLIGRSLALNAIIDLNFNVKTKVVKEWLTKHEVVPFLTTHESSLLELGNDAISERNKNNLAWSLDALWALMWAGQLIEELDFESPIPDEMYDLCPHVSEDEGPGKFANKMQIRSFDEIYRELDLYYRLHWYAFQNQIRDEIGTFDLSRFIERRRALEWLLSPDLNWDSVPLNT